MYEYCAYNPPYRYHAGSETEQYKPIPSHYSEDLQKIISECCSVTPSDRREVSELFKLIRKFASLPRSPQSLLSSDQSEAGELIESASDARSDPVPLRQTTATSGDESSPVEAISPQPPKLRRSHRNQTERAMALFKKTAKTKSSAEIFQHLKTMDEPWTRRCNEPDPTKDLAIVKRRHGQIDRICTSWGIEADELLRWKPIPGTGLLRTLLKVVETLPSYDAAVPLLEAAIVARNKPSLRKGTRRGTDLERIDCTRILKWLERAEEGGLDLDAATPQTISLELKKYSLERSI